MREWSWRWALPPLAVDASPRAQREHRYAVVAAEAELRWRWREVCAGGDLIRRIVPTGTTSWEGPQIGPITLGPPTRLSVLLRPGQLPRDLEDVRERLAAAFDVDDVVVRVLAHEWVTVELVEHGIPEEPDAPAADPRSHRLPPPSPRHFPRRRRRGPSGGPRRGR